MFGSEAATAIAPMEATDSRSKIPCQLTPLSVVFMMPPVPSPT
jgi:hypothetical protein